MRISTQAMETLAQLVQELEAGHVLQGLLRFPTEIDGHAVGSTDLEYWLSPFIGQQVIVILMPLDETKPRQGSQTGAFEENRRE